MVFLKEENIGAEAHIMHSINSETCRKCALCADGLIPPAVERNKGLRELFQVHRGNEVLASMIVGYPQVSFKRGIRRELAKVRWV